VVLDAEERQRLVAQAFQRLSFRSTWVSSTSLALMESGSTAKLWLWAVISTLPVALLLHRMIAAVVAEFELVGLPPRARPQSWWPRQIPKTGTRPIMSRMAFTA
jgi:hypothetical protein